ncbi:hypothetical protein [Flavisolibacter tropicus]|uniref:Uncharacterized protein n=1 Tax=Flavisolibacter tropicus TaxID=1492898 RepID=A0A172U2C8_9BACT|nr:hypothetical protein [Flavisolibacter tropicus]ANE53147.1 hypothetical protein SY85_24410 [Flavisolibacter tropicus]
MQDWIFKGFRPIAEPSNVTDNSGLLPKEARKFIVFQNTITGELSITTDLAYNKKRKKTALELFRDIYQKPFTTKNISIMLIVVYEDSYPSIGAFISDFKKKLRRKNMIILGYVWTRDVGDEKFKKHIHLMMAIERIEGKEFREMMQKKRSQGYEIELCNNVEGFKKYLLVKELYGTQKQRSFGRSSHFLTKPPIVKQLNTDECLLNCIDPIAM